MNRYRGFSYLYCGRWSRHRRRWTPCGSRIGRRRSQHGSYSPKFSYYIRYRFLLWQGRASSQGYLLGASLYTFIASSHRKLRTRKVHVAQNAVFTRRN